MDGGGQSRWTVNAGLKRRQPLPPIMAGRYLVEAFHESGRVLRTMDGPMPLSWAEIDAFARQTGAISEPWEARCLRSMSMAYLEGLKVGENPLGRAPWEI